MAKWNYLKFFISGYEIIREFPCVSLRTRTPSVRGISFEKFPLSKVDYSIIIKSSVLVFSGSSNLVWWAGISLKSNLAGGEI